MTPEEKKELEKLRADLRALNDEFYRGNFTASQDFNKYIRVNYRLKVPTLASAPATCEIGEMHVLSSNGKLYVCSASNTWTIVGTQS